MAKYLHQATDKKSSVSFAHRLAATGTDLPSDINGPWPNGELFHGADQHPAGNRHQ